MSILIARDYPDEGCASDGLRQILANQNYYPGLGSDLVGGGGGLHI